MTVLAGVLLGLLGSGHCVGMCGPLVLAIGRPGREERLPMRLVHVGSYHAGRVTTYALLGLAAGAVGSLMALAGLGRALAIAGGVILLMAGLGPATLRRRSWWTGPWLGIAARVSTFARRCRTRHPIAGRYAAGLANGLLPCGMVYAALATALAAGSVGSAVFTMVAFGAGTVPALATVSLCAAQVPPDWRRRLARAAPVGLAVVGVLLLVRGLTPPPAEVDAASPRPAHAVQGHRH